MDDTFLRMIFFGIDKIIYQFIPTVYSFIKSLIGYGSGTGGLFGNAAIADIARNIYSLLGVLMIIKLAFSMIQYIVNPDLFDDKTKGFASLIKRVFVVLILIVAVPYIFDFAYRLQDQIVNNQIIEKVILGNQEEYEDNSGNLLSERTLQAFLKEGDTPVSLDRLGDLKINEKVASGYRYDYMYLLSTIAGAFVLFLLIVFSYDIALRIVKLGFLQLIAPIPVISYLDPKNSFKDGIMGKWVKITLSSYLALFTRIMSIAFLIFVINIIPDVITDVSGNSLFIILLLIIGTLMFVKEAPKLIGDIFGLDMSSSFGGLKALNPLGKMAGGGLIGGALGLGTGLAFKAAAKGGGALLGGMASKYYGGSFKSGALKAAMASGKGIPMKGGIGKQALAAFKGMGAGRDAAASAAAGKEVKGGLWNNLKQGIDNRIEADNYAAKEEAAAAAILGMQGKLESAGMPRGGTATTQQVSTMFKNDEFRNAYLDLSTKKADVKSKTQDVTRYTRELTEKQNRYTNLQQSYEEALASGNATAQTYYTNQLQIAANELTTSKTNLDTANKNLTDLTEAKDRANAKFEELQKLGINKQDTATYKVFQKGRNEKKF